MGAFTVVLIHLCVFCEIDLLDGLDLGSLSSMGPGIALSFERPAAGPGRRAGGNKERQVRKKAALRRRGGLT